MGIGTMRRHRSGYSTAVDRPAEPADLPRGELLARLESEQAKNRELSAKVEELESEQAKNRELSAKVEEPVPEEDVPAAEEPAPSPSTSASSDAPKQPGKGGKHRS